MIIDLIFLPVVFFIGAVTSYQDFESGKIKNKWIKAGLLWGIIAYLALFLWFRLSFLFPSAISAAHFSFVFPANYFIGIFINSLISLVVGYLFWHFELWAAGDAKLFFVFSLLLPLKYYANSAFPYFPSLVMLLNIFTLAFAFLVLRSAYVFFLELDASSLRLKGEKGLISSTAQYFRKNYLALVKTIIIFFSIIFIFQLLRFKLGSMMNFGGSQQFGNAWYVLIFLGLSRSFVYFKKLMKKTWILALAYLAIFPYFWMSGFFRSTQNISSIFSLVTHSLIFSVIFTPIIFLLIHVQKKQEQKKMPFALWVFLGVIVTIILRGSLISLILNYRNFFLR